jgi:hypothetical protein
MLGVWCVFTYFFLLFGVVGANLWFNERAACGPSEMVTRASRAAVENGCHFHAESFEL